MEKAIITFEVSKDKTEVITKDFSGNGETIDITGTEIEKLFTKILKKLSERQLTNQIVDAIDIKKWQEV